MAPWVKACAAKPTSCPLTSMCGTPLSKHAQSNRPKEKQQHGREAYGIVLWESGPRKPKPRDGNSVHCPIHMQAPDDSSLIPGLHSAALGIPDSPDCVSYP